jgi:ABC-type siderophore export system fused ATPase/permease subunit
VSFTAITLCVASQRAFVVVVVCLVMTHSGNFWIHLRIFDSMLSAKHFEADDAKWEGYMDVRL